MMEDKIKPVISLYKTDYNEECPSSTRKGIFHVLTLDNVKPLTLKWDKNPLFMLLAFASSLAHTIKSDLEILLDENQKRFVAQILIKNNRSPVFRGEALEYFSLLSQYAQELKFDYNESNIIVTAYLYY